MALVIRLPEVKLSRGAGQVERGEGMQKEGVTFFDWSSLAWLQGTPVFSPAAD